MTPIQEEFFEKCPAWARSEGIESLAEWQIVKRLMPLAWTDRNDQLDRIKAMIKKVLEYWDAMSNTDFRCNSCGETSVKSDHCKFCGASAGLTE